MPIRMISLEFAEMPSQIPRSLEIEEIIGMLHQRMTGMSLPMSVT